MKSRTRVRTALLGMLVALTGLSGCEAFNAAETSMQVDSAEARVTMDRFVERPGPLKEPDTIQTVDGIWLGANAVRIAKGDPLPRSTDMVTLISAEPLGLQDIATEVTTLTGIPVILDTGAGLGGGLGSGPVAAAPPTLAGDGFTDANSGALGGGSFGAPGGLVTPSSDTIQLSFSGPLGGLLDLLSTRFNIAWEYKSGAIRFYEQETRVYTLYALSGLLDSSSTVGTEAEGDAETGGFSLTSSIDANQSVAVDVFNEIVAQISAMAGGNVTASPSSGTISVTARPHTLERVASFVTEQNERLSRQISLYVQVLSIELNQTDDINLDLSLLLNNGQISASAITPGNALQPAITPGTIAGTILSGLNENLQNSSFAFNAIAQERKTSVVQSTNLITMNGMPVPFQSVTQTRFVAEVSEESENTDAGSTSTITTTVDDLITGFSISLTPRIIADGGVLLQYTINISDLVDLVQIDVGGTGSTSFVQIPTVDVVSFIQQAVLRSGQTLALAGFETADNNTVETETGIPENIATGGSKTGQVDRTLTIVLITPKIINSKDLLRGNLL